MGWYIDYHKSKELDENSSSPIKIITKGDLSIWCFPSQKYPHINIYERNMTTATKCARVSLVAPKYLYPKDCDISIWKLSDSEKKELINILQSDNTTEEFEDIKTVWNYIIRSYNFEMRCSGYDYRLPYNLPIPDYMKL